MFTQHHNVGRRPYSSACGLNVRECQLNGQGVGEGECVVKVKEEVRDGRGGEGEGIRFGAQWTPLGHQLVDISWDAVDTRCIAGQVNYTIDLQL